MLRGPVKQLSSILSSASSVLQPLSSSSTTTATVAALVPKLFNQQKINNNNGTCIHLIHTSAAHNSNKAINYSDRDSIRQKTIEVSPDASSPQFQYTGNKSLSGLRFPTADLMTESFDGVPFQQIPVIHIKATSNNTIVSVADGDGNVLCLQSGGTVGFRNARKGTNVAAQTAAIALAKDALKQDITQARVCLKGIGSGRFPALKAIEMSGIKVVSITDTTPLAYNGNRPKKVRRL